MPERSEPDWSQIVEQYGPLVWKTASRLLSHEADAADCFQETFVAAWNASVREPIGHWRPARCYNSGMSAEPGRFKSLRRLVLLIVIGALLVGLGLWWRSGVPLHPVVDAFTHETLSPLEVKFARIAKAEVERREGWSGKIRVVEQDRSRWSVWVEREPGKDAGKRLIRVVDINGETGKVLNYRESGNWLPDWVWSEAVDVPQIRKLSGGSQGDHAGMLRRNPTLFLCGSLRPYVASLACPSACQVRFQPRCTMCRPLGLLQ
jgi:hypothetical protein